MNICRPIILHSEFLPACTGKRVWRYRAFGHYDGITVGECIHIEKYENLKQLFDICLQEDEDSFRYFSQKLLGFHADTEEEKQFWTTPLPFLYIVLLQATDAGTEEYRKYLESKEFLEKELSSLGLQDEIKNTLITVYHSLDNSDLIAVMKCGHANTGARLINSLHCLGRDSGRIPIRNSYSILGIDQKEIENPGAFIKANEPIEEMELRVIESDNHSIGSLYQKLKDELDVPKSGITTCLRSLIGTEDASITIKNVPWERLLPLYRKRTGILNNSNKQAQNYAYAVSTKILLPFPEQEKKDGEERKADIKKKGDIRKYFCDWLREKIDGIYEGRNSAGQLTEKKNLVMFAKSLFRFENAHYSKKEFSEFNFFELYLPFYHFVELLGEKDCACPEDYYDFMESLRLRTQSFVKSDRVFSQITDFNMRYFDVPVKFITIYSAYIHYFKQALNTIDGKRYEFLVCPGMNSQIGVIELFLKVSDRRRLFFIEIPEQQMYNLKQIFIMTGHEIAHFVGTDVRCRHERETHLVRLCSRIIALSMKNYLANEDDFVREHVEDLEFEKMESKLCEWLAFFVGREQDPEYLREHKYSQSVSGRMLANNLAYKKKYGEHSDVLRETLISSVAELLFEHGQDIFGYIFHRKFYEEEHGYEERDAFWAKKADKLQHYIYNFIDYLNSENQALTIGSAIDKIIYLVKECYADMICILTLRLTLKDYLGALTEIAEEFNTPIEKLEDTELPARIAIVMTVVSHSLDNYPDPEGLLFQWTEQEFTYEVNEESPIRKLEEASNAFAHNYIAREEKIHPSDVIGKSVGLIYDQKILYEIIAYLLKCRKKYFKFLNNKKKKEIIKEKNQYVRDIYALSQERESGEFFGKLADIIFRYEADVYAEMQGIMRSKK